MNLVENLLVVTRLDNGTMALKTEPELVEDVIREAFHHLNRKAALHELRVQVDDPLLMAQMDGRLIMQVIINLVNNAVTYTPEGSRITVSARRAGRGQRRAWGSWPCPWPTAPASRRPTAPRYSRCSTRGRTWAATRERRVRPRPGLCKSIMIHGTIAVDALPERAHLSRPSGHRHHVHAACGRIRGEPRGGRATGGRRVSPGRSRRRRRGRMTDAGKATEPSPSS
ncbi:MAG: sensor histidine kinase [Eggerthellaceae bacterium]